MRLDHSLAFQTPRLFFTRVTGRGLEAPALLWLDSLRPLSYLGSQAMHFLHPLVQLVVPAERFGRLAEILEERSHLERLLLHLEALAGEEET